VTTTVWVQLDPRAHRGHLGTIPSFLDPDDSRPAVEQFRERYVGSWRNLEKATVSRNGVMRYPGDPPLAPLFGTTLRDEVIFVYDCALVAVVTADGRCEVSRMD